MVVPEDLIPGDREGGEHDQHLGAPAGTGPVPQQDGRAVQDTEGQKPDHLGGVGPLERRHDRRDEQQRQPSRPLPAAVTLLAAVAFFAPAPGAVYDATEAPRRPAEPSLPDAEGQMSPATVSVLRRRAQRLSPCGDRVASRAPSGPPACPLRMAP